MKKTFQKAISGLMIVLMVVFSVPVAQLVGIDWSAIGSMFDIKAEAKYAPVESFSPEIYMSQIILNYDYDGSASLFDGSTLANMRYNRYTDIEMNSVAFPTLKELNSNYAFIGSVAAWELLTFTPTDFYQPTLDRIAYYQTIIFKILDCYVENSWIPDSAESYARDVVDMTNELVGIDKSLIDATLSDPDVFANWDGGITKVDLYTQLYDSGNKAGTRVQFFEDAAWLVNGVFTFKDLIERIASLKQVDKLASDVKNVIKELYVNASGTDVAMQLALKEINEVISSEFDKAVTEMIDIGVSGLECIFSHKFSLFWGKTVLPALFGKLASGVVIGQLIGRGIANILFSTDATIEQWYKLCMLVNFESLMIKTVGTLANKFKSNPNDGNAENFLASISLLKNTYLQDYELSREFASIIYETGLVNKIKTWFGKNEDLTKFKQDIDYLKNSLTDLSDIIDFGFYSEHLKKDNLEAYNNYFGIDGQIIDVNGSESKICTVKCPTDINIYDSNGQLVASIIDNEVEYCAVDAFCVVEGNKKHFILDNDEEYRVIITGTDDGSMNYYVEELKGSTGVRSLVYNSVPLEKGCTYEGDIPDVSNAESNVYDLISDDGIKVNKTFDSLTDSISIIDIAKALSYQHPYVDIKEYEIPVSEAADVINTAKEYFEDTYGYDCDGTFSYEVVYDSHKNTVVKFKFTYGTGLDSSAPMGTVDAEVNVLNEIKAYTNGMSDFDKAVYIHDYLVLNGEYDIELGELIEESGGTLSEELRKERYEKYALLVNGTGVCDTYATAYEYLLENCGVECITVTSNAMNHAWNMVKLNGSWYHVDCTWDDPVMDRIGLSRYDYFLLNESEIKENEHYYWSPVYTSASTTYSQIPRDDTDEVAYGNGRWCYYNDGDLYCSDAYGKNAVKITEMDFDATDIYGNYIYGVIGKVLYRISITNPNQGYEAIYALEEAPKAIYIDKDGILEYYTYIGKSFERVDVTKCSAVQSISISGSDNVSKDGEEIQLTVTGRTAAGDIIIPNDSIIWTTSDEAIATVTESGVVIPDMAGTVVISADFGGVKADYTVTVEKWKESAVGYINGIKWTFDDSEDALIIEGEGELPEIQNTSDAPWYKYRKHIKRLEIADGIVRIDKNVFADLSEIKELTIPDSVDYIGEGAFAGCDSLEKLSIPFVGSSRNAENTYDSVVGHIFGRKETGTMQYYKTDGSMMTGTRYGIPSKLKEIIVTDAVKISFGAFYGCAALERVEINDEVVSIADRVLAKCESLVSLKVPFIGSSREAEASYDAVVGYFFGGGEKDKTLQFMIFDYDESIGRLSYSGYYYDIPASFKKIEVTDDEIIPTGAFSSLVLDEIILSKATALINDFAFLNVSSVGKLMILNKECEIKDRFGLISMSGTIHSYSDSLAKDFAQRKGIRFVAIDETTCPHYFGSWQTVSSATCETNGTQERYCSECGYTESKAISALGHETSTVSWTTEKAATCAETGLEVKRCSRCNEIVERRNVDKISHNLSNWMVRTASTCDVAGVEYRKCSMCTYEETRNTNALGHDYSRTWTVDENPTCTDSGSESRHCSRCRSTTDAKVIEALGHDTEGVSWTTEKDETCTEDGLKVKRCSRCNEIVEEEIIEKTGHSLSGWKVRRAPTCENKGVEYRSCSKCSYEKTRKTAALGHSYEAEWTVDVVATCTEDGSESRHCVNCNEKIDVVVIEAQGHEFEESKCTVCDYDRADDCDCNCHKSGFSKLIFKFLLFFQKLFGKNQECPCGISHY